jgi:transcriptional regulator with XRE-family HTH domain
VGPMPGEMPIGRRIQMYRLRRGLTQEVLAQRVGRSTSWLSQVERGINGVDNWRLILDLADILQCDPRDLVGQPLNLAPNGGVPFRGLDDLRALLTGYEWLLATIEHPAVSGPTPAIDELQSRVDDGNRQYQGAQYESAARGLVQVVRDAEQIRGGLASGSDDRAINGMLAQGYQAVAKTLTKIDQPDLAWVAAERAAAAAMRADDPLLVAASTYHLGHALRRLGRVVESMTASERGYEVLSRRLLRDRRDAAFLGLAGGLTLTSVIAAASAGDSHAVSDLLARAEALAGELGSDGNAYWFAFGPTNVLIHRLAVAVELGEARDAVRIGETIDTANLPPGLVGRRTAALIDLARAYGQLKMDAAAVNMLTDAERLAAQTVRYNKFVRELTRELLRREHRATTPQLRPFAQRLGLID